MTNASAPRRALRRLLGVDHDASPSTVGGYSTARRVIAALLGVRLPVHPGASDPSATPSAVAIPEPGARRWTTDQSGLVHGEFSLFACDIANLAGSAYSDSDRIQLRLMLYESVESSFAGAGIPWSSVYHEDRGDGVLIIIPANFDGSRLITGVIDRLRSELGRYNDSVAIDRRMRIRVAVHVGDIVFDTHGPAGSAINYLFLLLDAPMLKTAQRIAGVDVAWIVSNRVYEDFLRPGRARATPAEYQQIEFQVKEATQTAWMRVPRDLPGELPAAGRRLTAREREIAQLVADGLSDQQISVRLSISPRSVQNHLSRIFAKLGVVSRDELTRVSDSDG